MPIQQDLGDLGRGGARRPGPRRLDVDLLQVAAAPAEQVVPCRRDRHYHHVILVVKSTRRTLLGENTDHAEALAVDFDHLADWVLAAEQIGDHRLTDDGDFAGGVDIARREELATGQRVVADRGEILRGAGQAAVPVLVAEGQLGPPAGARYRGHDVRRTLAVRDRLDIIEGQGRAGAKALLHAAGASRVRREDGEQVRPKRLNLLLHGDRCAVADPDEQADGRHADQNAEHGESRPQPVGQQSIDGEPPPFKDAHRTSSAASGWRSSLTITPSRSRTTRCAKAAMSASCVIRTIVRPCWFKSRSSFKISRLDSVSRLPVGSSASRIAGSVTSARATATRCCWPPESSFGRWPARSSSPTDSRAAIARSRRCTLSPA